MRTDNNTSTQALVDELHRDVYIAYYEHKMTLEQIAHVMKMTPETIRQMIQTYQERLERGTVA